MIYGWRSKELGQVDVPGACGHCGAEGEVTMHILQKYVHILWIPLFPIGKSGVTQCTHCKEVLVGKELPPEYKELFKAVKGQHRTPVWMFAGPIIIAALTPFAIHQSNKHNARVLEQLNAPQVGDVYEVKESSRNYTLYKVREVKGDSVFVARHTHLVSKQRGLWQLRSDGDEAYTDERLGFDKQGLVQMQQAGDILDVDRD